MLLYLIIAYLVHIAGLNNQVDKNLKINNDYKYIRFNLLKSFSTFKSCGVCGIIGACAANARVFNTANVFFFTVFTRKTCRTLTLIVVWQRQAFSSILTFLFL